jgi:hypothetical protein
MNLAAHEAQFVLFNYMSNKSFTSARPRNHRTASKQPNLASTKRSLTVSVTECCSLTIAGSREVTFQFQTQQSKNGRCSTCKTLSRRKKWTDEHIHRERQRERERLRIGNLFRSHVRRHDFPSCFAVCDAGKRQLLLCGRYDSHFNR